LDMRANTLVSPANLFEQTRPFCYLKAGYTHK
jgi:hypothetical protein